MSSPSGDVDRSHRFSRGLERGRGRSRVQRNVAWPFTVSTPLIPTIVA